MVEVAAKQAVTDFGNAFARASSLEAHRHGVASEFAVAPYRPYVPASAWRKGGDKLGHDVEFDVLAVPAGDLAHDIWADR
jgi:hypothetical protein